MSDNPEKNFSRFDGMTVQQLEEILRTDAMGAGGEQLDADALFYIMELLAALQPLPKTAEEAYAEFREDYLPAGASGESLYAGQKKKPTGTKRKPAGGFYRLLVAVEAVAAVLAIVFCGALAANVLGFDLGGILNGWKKPTVSVETPGSVGSVAIPDAHGNEIATGTVTIDRYSISAHIDEEDGEEHSYEVSVSYSFYPDNTSQLNDYWTVLGGTTTTVSSGSFVLGEYTAGTLREAEVTFREESSSQSVTQTVTFTPFIFE